MKKILITNNKPYNSICCVCDNADIAFDYLRSVNKNKPLKARNFKNGTAEKWLYEIDGSLETSKESLADWQYILSEDYYVYYLTYVDYIN